MYLKTLEMIGFKSFSEKTKLLFEPGMTAIVGPNGCGKSNISDAIRWVLGEQRPTALRGGKMQDVIFSGTDERKALNMAEVSITFADCEALLKTEYNEITLTRRLFRSGEGHYLLNRTPCRLRDIHRLLMGTGIGTASYSVMAQGQIDAILSSRPEDRRAVFEEASGITKFKSDRNEAMRKLEQTDANLLRLEDVIREVKRQIGSLQRQAGKARRYESLREEIRGLDLFVNRRRLGSLDIRIRELDAASRELKQNIDTARQHAEQRDGEITRQRTRLLDIEREIGQAAEDLAQARNQLTGAREKITLNMQRIREYQDWTERDNREMSETHASIKTQDQRLRETEKLRVEAAEDLAVSEKDLENCRTRFTEAEQALAIRRAELHKLRDASLEGERQLARIQNRLADIERSRRGSDIQHERLRAEREQLAHHSETIERQREEIRQRIARHSRQAETLDEQLSQAERNLDQAETELRARHEALARERSDRAARQAQVEMFEDREEAQADYQPGSRLLLEIPEELGLPPGAMLGTLADGLHVEAPYRAAVEVALRAWINSVVIDDPVQAREVIRQLRKRGRHAAVRMVARRAPPSAASFVPTPGLQPLADFIHCSPETGGAIRALLANVFLAEDFDAFSLPLPEGVTVVTRAGDLFRGNGAAELWMPDTPVSSPLSRRMTLSDLREAQARSDGKTAEISSAIEKGEGDRDAIRTRIRDTRRALEEVRRELAQAEGEQNRIERDAERNASRLETVAWEIGEVEKNNLKSDEERAETSRRLDAARAGRETLAGRIEETTAAVQTAEQEFAALQHELAEHRVAHASRKQALAHHAASAEDLRARIEELRRNIGSRKEGLASYLRRIQDLEQETSKIESRTETMAAAVTDAEKLLEQRRRECSVQADDLKKIEAEQTRARQEIEDLHQRSSRAETALTEHRMRRANRLERMASEYGISPEKLAAMPDPDWPGGEEPSLEETEARIGEMNAKLEAMGPVNLVAIEEYRQIEERHAFLKAQEQDLVKARDQVLDLIRRINKRSAEMFRETFNQANENFQKMFGRLFTGGTARLVLLDAEDILESGIDIVARPPGKKLRSISLLSGGERTLTAVSLLFAIYMIKPSPFCLLDELDAALDDSNIGRFVGVLHDFLHQSQFVLITHNHHTIAASDVVYGVTMPEKGISKIVSLRLDPNSGKTLDLDGEEIPNEGKNGAPKTAASPEPTPIPESAPVE